MNNLILNLICDEKKKIKIGFDNFVKINKNMNCILKSAENERHFAEIVFTGYTLFAEFHEEYDDSIIGSYLKMGVMKGVLIDGKKDIFCQYEEISTNKYDFVCDEKIGWIERDERKLFYSSIELVEKWTQMIKVN